MLEPQSSAELAEALREAAAHQRTIALAGNASKHLMAGPNEPADVAIATTALRRVLQYEPHDLTISVEAGLPWSELTALLARNRQMVPLDPPFAESATVGGVIAANSSGPRRRLYGTARDLVIGMRFATLEGKLVQSEMCIRDRPTGALAVQASVGGVQTPAGVTLFVSQP